MKARSKFPHTKENVRNDAPALQEATANEGFTRRDFLKETPALIVGFSLAGNTGLFEGSLAEAAQAASDPRFSQVDSWLAIGQDETVTLFSGKMEMGTGSSTGRLQIAAEELDVSLDQMRLVQCITGTTPDQYVSSASNGITGGGPPIRQAAAEARQKLLQLASARLGAPIDQLVVANGVVTVKSDPTMKVSYGQLIGGQHFNLTMKEVFNSSGGLTALQGTATPKGPSTYKIVGASVPRVDIPGKVTGEQLYVHDIRVPGMVHGRVVRPPSHGASVISIDESSVSSIPGVIKVVRKGDFVGVVAEKEWQAIQAADKLKVTWTEWAGLPRQENLYDTFKHLPTVGDPSSATGDVNAGLSSAAKVVTAAYGSPYQMHASIGPSCAVADVRQGEARVWSGTQGVYGLRYDLSVILNIPEEKVVVEWVHAAGCYGNNGADDVTSDAAVLSQAVGRPVRVQWMRQEEHGWEPYCSARASEFRGGLDAQGKIVAWDQAMWTFATVNRPANLGGPGGVPGNLSTAQLLGLGLTLGGPESVATPEVPWYSISNMRSVNHDLGPTSHRGGVLRIRTGSMRSTNRVPRAFPMESFMDELAVAAGADAFDFRLRHLADPRTIALFRAAKDKFAWQGRPSPNPDRGSGSIAKGRGLSLHQRGTFRSAVMVEIEVNRETGVLRFPRIVVAFDGGLIINPHAVIQQMECCVIQGISRAVLEEVKFSQSTITSLHHVSYPIVRFTDVPDKIDYVLINLPDQPSVGAGEESQSGVAPAIANAIFDATGVRIRRLPLSPERVLAALKTQ